MFGCSCSAPNALRCPSPTRHFAMAYLTKPKHTPTRNSPNHLDKLLQNNSWKKRTKPAKSLGFERNGPQERKYDICRVGDGCLPLPNHRPCFEPAPACRPGSIPNGSTRKAPGEGQSGTRCYRRLPVPAHFTPRPSGNQRSTNLAQRESPSLRIDCLACSSCERTNEAKSGNCSNRLLAGLSIPRCAALEDRRQGTLNSTPRRTSPRPTPRHFHACHVAQTRWEQGSLLA